MLNRFQGKQLWTFCFLNIVFFISFWRNTNMIKLNANRRRDDTTIILHPRRKLNTAWKMSKYGVFLVRIFPHSDWIRRDTPSYSARMRENTDQKKLRIWTLFTKCKSYNSSCSTGRIQYTEFSETTKKCENKNLTEFLLFVWDWGGKG